MRRNTHIAPVVLCFLALVAVAACSGTGTGGDGATPQPVAVPTPEAGKATITGRLVNTQSREPYRGIVVRLGEVIHFTPGDMGSWFIDDANSPGAYTNTDGDFVISNVNPKEYVLVVGDFNQRYAVVTDTPDNAKVWNPAADVVLELGEVDVVLP